MQRSKPKTGRKLSFMLTPSRFKRVSCIGFYRDPLRDCITVWSGIHDHEVSRVAIDDEFGHRSEMRRPNTVRHLRAVEQPCLQTAVQMNIPAVDKTDLPGDAALIRREQENDRGCDFARVSQPASERYLRGDAS